MPKPLVVEEPIAAWARRVLEERRRELSGRRAAALHDADELFAERETGWEDRAADVTAASTLGRLSDDELGQLYTVMAALERLDTGTWGRCIECRRPIPEARLRAMPEASRCAQHTNHH